MTGLHPEDSLEEIRISGGPGAQMKTVLFPNEKAAAESIARQTGNAAGKAAVFFEGLPMPTHESLDTDPSKMTFDLAFNKAYSESLEKRFRPFDLFYSSCRDFYRVVVAELIQRFDFSDSLFELVDLVKPVNARNLKPKSLRLLFQRFPILKEECDVVKADTEWRDQASLPIGLFLNDVNGNIETVDVEEYWLKIFSLTTPASVGKKDPVPRFPNLEKCVSLLLCIPCSNVLCERCFSQMNLTMTPQRNSLHPQTISALLAIHHWLKSQKETPSTVKIPPELIELTKKVQSNGVIQSIDNDR